MLFNISSVTAQFYRVMLRRGRHIGLRALKFDARRDCDK
jgi:hypothetical protein